jgi:hypothetical protein
VIGVLTVSRPLRTKTRRAIEIRLTAEGSTCCSYITWGRPPGFGPDRLDTKETYVKRTPWSTEKPQGLAGSVASTCVSAVPAYGFMAANVRHMDHAIDALAWPMGTTGGSTG